MIVSYMVIKFDIAIFMHNNYYRLNSTAFYFAQLYFSSCSSCDHTNVLSLFLRHIFDVATISLDGLCFWPITKEIGTKYNVSSPADAAYISNRSPVGSSFLVILCGLGEVCGVITCKLGYKNTR